VITVDHRERASGLVDQLARRWPSVAVGALVVGDVRIGPRILVERKTIEDFVASIRDRRLYRQLFAMCGECSRPLLVLEGPTPIPVAGLDPEALRGILLSVAIGYRVPMLRTLSVVETASYLAGVAVREERRLERSKYPTKQPGPLSVLASVPGVGEERAAALLERFGDVATVLCAPASALRQVPGVGPHTARTIRRVAQGRRDPDEAAADEASQPKADGLSDLV
jgi:Fanconi anemia group M protein